MVYYIKVNHSLKLEEKIDAPNCLSGGKYGKGRKIKGRLKDGKPKLAIKIILIVAAIAASIAISLMYPQVRTTLANLNSDVTEVTVNSN